MIGLLKIFVIMLAQLSAPAKQALTGIATGHVMTLDGKPAAGVRVSAMSAPDPKDPTGGGVLVSLAASDSAGSYRLENIPPGSYYIQAGLLDFPSYYPGVASIETAKTISVAAGEVVEGLDFKMTRPPGVRVSGRVPLNMNPRPRMVMLVGAGGGGTPVSGVLGGTFVVGGGVSGPGGLTRIVINGGSMAQPISIDPDGSFEFLRVKPGNYTVIFLPSDSQMRITFEVDDKDIELGLPPGPGVKISGVVGLGSGAANVPAQRVVLTGANGWAQVETTVDASSGKFEFVRVPAGTYAIRTIPGTPFPISTIVVANEEITGIVLPASLDLPGRAFIDDQTGSREVPALSPPLTLVARRVDGTMFSVAIGPTVFTVYANGGVGNTFRFPLVEGEYEISVRNVPPAYTVKSLTYGSIDLLKGPLKLDGSSKPMEFLISLVKEP